MNTVMLLDMTGIIQYSIYFCGVIIITFVLGFKLGQDHGRKE